MLLRLLLLVPVAHRVGSLPSITLGRERHAVCAGNPLLVVHRLD